MTPLVQERVGDADGLIQQPAGVVAQVEDDALDGALALGVGQGVEQLLRGAFAEAGEADPVVAGLEFAGLHADERDGVALDAQVHGLLGVAVQDGQHHFGAFGAADMRDGFLKRHFQRGLAAHGEDDVAGLHAALGRRAYLRWGSRRSAGCSPS